MFSDPCESVKCDAYKACSRRALTSYECVCQQCSSKYNLVCGSNGWTYASECHLRKYSCDNELSLNVQSNGPCGEYPYIFFLRVTVYPNPTALLKMQARRRCLHRTSILLKATSNAFLSLLAHRQSFFIRHLFDYRCIYTSSQVSLGVFCACKRRSEKDVPAGKIDFSK